MNKDKPLEFIAQQRKEHACPQDNYGLGYFKALEDMENKIQSEPEETKPIDIDGVKTNTYTTEKVAELILEYALELENSKNFAIDMETDDVLYWLNEKAGE